MNLKKNWTFSLDESHNESCLIICKDLESQQVFAERVFSSKFDTFFARIQLFQNVYFIVIRPVNEFYFISSLKTGLSKNHTDLKYT